MEINNNENYEQIINIKIQHIRNIKKSIEEENIYDNALFAITLSEVIRQNGLHTLPLRVLYELDRRLDDIAKNKKLLNSIISEG